MFTLISAILKRASGLKNIACFSFSFWFLSLFSLTGRKVQQEALFLVFLLAVVYGFYLGMEARPQ
jgi:hypothetical protein